MNNKLIARTKIPKSIKKEVLNISEKEVILLQKDNIFKLFN